MMFILSLNRLVNLIVISKIFGMKSFNGILLDPYK